VERGVCAVQKPSPPPLRPRRAPFLDCIQVIKNCSRREKKLTGLRFHTKNFLGKALLFFLTGHLRCCATSGGGEERQRF
jgi:hypothetical protein